MSGPLQPRVLVADDDFMIARDLEHQLSSYGYEVVGIARDGLEVVTLATELEPNVTILDLEMPGQGGIEQRLVPDARWTAEFRQQDIVQGQHHLAQDPDGLPHSARARRVLR